MSRSADHWRAVYEPMLNQRLNAAWFYPLTCDTPGVVRDLQAPIIAFSGAVGLEFEGGADHYLTWEEVAAADFELSNYAREGEVWCRSSVDRVRVSPEKPWGRIHGSQLTKVEMYACKGVIAEPITTAAHHLKTADGVAVMWISTASGSFAGSGDDLLVSIDHDPTNSECFQLAGTIQ